MRSEDEHSRLVTMTIGEYQASRAQHAEHRRAGVTTLPAPAGGLARGAAAGGAS